MIGIFDSGVGGLSAMIPLRTLLPNADLVYSADTAALHLGEKSDREIRDRLARALRFFHGKDIFRKIVLDFTLGLCYTPRHKKRICVKNIEYWEAVVWHFVFIAVSRWWKARVFVHSADNRRTEISRCREVPRAVRFLRL